jgi:NADPH:quinone reductase-like Zn-dependent oxidoreductase
MANGLIISCGFYHWRANGDNLERLEYDKYGGSEVVKLRAFTLRQPEANELLVRVAASSLNPLDWKIRNGDMKMMTGSKFPRAMGTDFSGTVEAVGAKVTRFQVTDAVVGTVSPKASGAFASYLITTESLAVKKPDTLTFCEAASLPLASATAWQALMVKARLLGGQRVFINGAMGAVGQAAFAITQNAGAVAGGRVGSHSLAEAKLRGLDPVLDYAKPIPESLHGRFDVVFDCNGSLSDGDAGKLLRRGGVIIHIVVNRENFLRSLISRSRKIVFSDPSVNNLQPVIDLAAAKKLAIPIARTIRLDQATNYLSLLEKGERQHGKIVIDFNTW